ncbi:MAG TPA: nitrate ABC transporter permease [Abditibacteriaceae bacterium]|jgi:nitrate/nitrite transport system permease protein
MTETPTHISTHALTAAQPARNEAPKKRDPRLSAALNGLKSAATGMLGFVLMLVVWQAMVMTFAKTIPGPLETFAELWRLVSNPFYDNGPNDKGIGIQVGYSLARVGGGWLIGSMIAIPAGIFMGGSEFGKKLFGPIVQIMRPVSPLAWYPIGLAVLKDAPQAVIFAIVITSLWPTLLNTMFGVASLPDDYKNVARVFHFSKAQYVKKILLPFALPHIITGLRLSMGIAWMVIVAGEMLAGGTGIGFFVWDSWNSLMLTRVISAILIIGGIGLLLDRGFEFLHRRFAYGS